MTSTFRNVEPAQVLRAAAVAPDEVPFYLAQMDDEELKVVQAAANGLHRLVTTVLAERKCSRLWEQAGREANRMTGSHAPVWTGCEPQWPTDDPVAPTGGVEDVAESTQIIPADTITHADTGTGVDVGDVAAGILGDLGGGAPVGLRVEELPHLGGNTGDGGEVVLVDVPPDWYPQPPAGEDWSAAQRVIDDHSDTLDTP